jgi:ABC-type transporter Mla subunit MlaD
VSGIVRTRDASLVQVRLPYDPDLTGRYTIHADARVKVYPRIFLEGAFFVDIRPGSRRAAPLPNGGTLPASQTSVPSNELIQALPRGAPPPRPAP